MKRWDRVIAELTDEEKAKLLMFGAEVGVYQGRMSAELLEKLPNLHLYMIDSYLPEHMPNDEPHLMLAQALKATAEWGHSRTIIVTDSIDGASYVKRQLLDFVFIDASHDAISVSYDLAAWSPRVKTGGLVAGHDWDDERYGKSVNNAVLDYLKHSGIEPQVDPDDETWWYRKRG